MGALSQLIAVGAQDVFLTGEPQRSLWKRVSVRRTNFAIESMETVFDINYGSSSMITIARSGDLIKSCVLQVTMRKSNIPSFYPVEQFIKSMTVVIGGQDVYIIEDAATWFRIHDETFNDVEMRAANYRMLNFRPEDPPGAVRTFYLDLPLFFTRHLSLALPLIALQYHDVQLRITFNEPYNIPGIDVNYQTTARFYADYVFLDKQERTYFAQAPHEYNIEQLQMNTFTPMFSETGVTPQSIDLNFNHPTRYIMWVYKTNLHGIYTTSNNQFETNDGYAPLDTAILRINGIDRFSERPGSYFNLVQTTQAVKQAPSAGIYMYSFGVNANDEDSSGTLNFSRVDMATLSLTNKQASAATIADVLNTSTTLNTAMTKFTKVEIFAVNFNVLRIQDGMGGVLFSN
ncbi:major capsid protein VP54 [Acanthocystis turfacea Chlorella virus MN0810.1]|nr:major capsid protein VP54 [Acanthocystis turfacea Chlorella virus MN0810.1]